MATEPSAGPSRLFSFLFVRSVPATIWVLLLLLVGTVAYRSMIKESLPDLKIPEAVVLTTWPGATPEMMEKEVTQRIERALRGLAGLKSLHSSSYDEYSIIAVRFRAESEPLVAMQKLRERVAQARPLLPRSAKAPRIEASSVRDLPIASFALLSRHAEAKVSEVELQRAARRLRKRLLTIPGLRKVVLSGGREETVKVQLYPERLRAFAVPASLIRQRIKEHNYDAPWGRFRSPTLAFRVKMVGTYRTLDDLRTLPIVRYQGRLLRLKDLARVERGFLQRRTVVALAWKGKPFVPTLSIELQKGAGRDTLKLVRAARAEIQRVQSQADWPQSLRCVLVGDDSKLIRDELSRGLNNGWQAMLGVFLVLLIMLTWREAFVAAVLIPLTLLGSLVVLWALGFTFNLLVIVGMILALGLLVDDFILILEGLHEAVYLHGKGLVEAIRYTLGTFAVPSFSGSVTTILVFLPLAFVGGVDGKFIRLIPITASICLAVSYVLSIVLAPPLSRLAFLSASRLRGRRGALDGETAHAPGRIDRWARTAGACLGAWLRRRVLSSRLRALAWLGGALCAFLCSLLLFAQLNDTLYPKEDGRQLGITVLLPPETELPRARRIADRLGEELRKKAYFSYVVKVVGRRPAFAMTSFHDLLGPQQGAHLLGFNCLFTPRKERAELAYRYVKPLRRELAELLAQEPGARLLMSPQSGGPSAEDPLQIDIEGEDMAQLRAIAGAIKGKMRRLAGFVDVRDNVGLLRSELRLRPIREALDFHEVDQNELAQQLIAYTEREHLAMFRRSGTKDDLRIRLGAHWPSRKGAMGGPKSWYELEGLHVINAKGKAVSLWSLVEPSMEQSQPSIVHRDGKRSVTVMAKLDGVYVSEAISKLRPTLDAMSESWPAGYSYRFAGEKEVTENVYGTMAKVFAVAMVLVYAILALLFNSLLQPLIILSTVIFALTGVFFGFFITGRPFSFAAAIGVVALVGIVVNDAIVVVDTMNGYLRQGLDAAEAACRGAADRLRPILSTTITNLVGLMPLALSDPGWAPICYAIIYGEIVATAGALVLVPALYRVLGRARRTSNPNP